MAWIVREAVDGASTLVARWSASSRAADVDVLHQEDHPPPDCGRRAEPGSDGVAVTVGPPKSEGSLRLEPASEDRVLGARVDVAASRLGVAARRDVGRDGDGVDGC